MKNFIRATIQNRLHLHFFFFFNDNNSFLFDFLFVIRFIVCFIVEDLFRFFVLKDMVVADEVNIEIWNKINTNSAVLRLRGFTASFILLFFDISLSLQIDWEHSDYFEYYVSVLSIIHL